MEYPFFRIIIIKLSIRWDHRKFFNLIKKTLSLGRKMIVSRNVPWDERSFFRKAAVFLLTKNVQTLQGIEVLCKNGFGQDSLSLLRAILESVINLAYINLDKEDRAQAYFEYEYFLKIKSGDILLKTNSGVDKVAIQNRIQKLKREWNKVKHKFLDRRGNECHTWSCKQLRAMAQDADMLSVYDWVYPLCSNYGHATSSIAYSYILGKDNKDKVIVEVGTSHQFIDAVLPTACSLLLYILDTVNNEFMSGFEKNIKKLKEELIGLRGRTIP